MNIGEYPEWRHNGPGSPYYDDPYEYLDDMSKEELKYELTQAHSRLDEISGHKYFALRDLIDELIRRIKEYDDD